MTWIAQGVAITLVICSVYSLYVTLERWLFFKKAKKQSLDFAKQATAALAKDQIQQAVDVARKFPASHLARVTRAGLIEFQLDTTRGASSGLSGHDLVESARRAIERETLITYSDFKKGVGALATIATTAPFIGLFGTVVGIINAFRGMSSGAGGIAAVSGGIAEALVTTALGLFVAIPAAWMFNYFTGVLERFSVEMSNSSSELIDFFIKKHGGSDAVGVRV
ncbi:MAG: MotA/TolQ/ExbB proton channel family protein [Thermoanaerobaculia bacterium]|nr:MotA/TolQ/ExbB proton channel family protein [Thermoanaerobaculia bacterium]MBP9822673.1 MotA/TolQ/ExbB proton channel family protein [Thermoanaerobaculia bacterium]